MKLTKENVCVFIEDEAQLEQVKNILDGYGEEIDDSMFRIPTFDGCNKLSKWRLDGKWRISNSDRNTITLTELEKILKGGKEN